MQIPNLPTDNLYKFIALSGLVALLISFLSSFYLEHKTQVKLADIESTGVVTDRMIERLSDTPVDSPEFDEQIRKTDELILQNMKNSELAVRLRKNELSYLEYREPIIWLSSAASIAGLLLWYFRVQRPLDMELKNRSAVYNKALKHRPTKSRWAGRSLRSRRLVRRYKS